MLADAHVVFCSPISEGDLEYYQVRWVVEVFNRESKQLLNLGGCRSSNFDALAAEITISMIVYPLLTLRFRYNNYESKGVLTGL